jgi:F420H(2)-dependent quinone reductase
VKARDTSGEERRRCWHLGVQVHPGYLAYDLWTPHREIPVIGLDPL